MCAALSCVQTALPIPISVCSIFLCPNGAAHSYQCVQHFPVSKWRCPFLSAPFGHRKMLHTLIGMGSAVWTQDNAAHVSKQRYPFLSVCAALSCVQTALPIPISVCSIILCPNSATHSYQCVQHFPVSKRRCPFLSVCAALSCVQTALPIPISVCSIILCPNSATHSYQCVQHYPTDRNG